MKRKVFALGLIVTLCGATILILTIPIIPRQTQTTRTETVVTGSENIMNGSVQLYGPSFTGGGWITHGVQVQLDSDQKILYSFSISSADSSAEVYFSIFVPQSYGDELWDDVYYNQTGRNLQGSWSPQENNTYIVDVANNDTQNSSTLGTITCNVTKIWTSNQTRTTTTNTTKSLIDPHLYIDGAGVLVAGLIIMGASMFMNRQKSQDSTATEDKLGDSRMNYKEARGVFLSYCEQSPSSQ